MIEAIEGLRRRSLVDRTEVTGVGTVTFQSVVLEFVPNQLVEDICDEIRRVEPLLLVEQPLIQAHARDYVRCSQERLIGAPILANLRAHYAERGSEQLLLGVLAGWRNRAPSEQGYGPGNVVNLLRLLRGDLRGLDLSGPIVRRAYLADVDAQDASLSNARLSETVVAEAFDFWGSIALSADGA